jgi:4-hydroxybenzoate polyprenyltransferase
MMTVGLVLLVWEGYRYEPMTQWRPVTAGLALAGAIVFYNWHHKNNPLSPLVMGVCRMLVYLTAALAVSMVVPVQVICAAVVLLCYLIGLTYAAKKEHLGRLENIWPLAFLAVPLIYGIYLALAQPMVVLPLVALAAWVLYALSLLRRRKPGDVPRAVVSLIAGISVLDAVLLAGAGAVMMAWFAIAAFGLTLALQRWVSGT